MGLFVRAEKLGQLVADEGEDGALLGSATCQPAL